MEFPISNNLRISNIRRALSHPGPYTENPMGPRIPVSTALIFSWHGPWWSLVGKVVVALAVVSPSSGGSFSGMCLSRCWLLSQPTIFGLVGLSVRDFPTKRKTVQTWNLGHTLPKNKSKNCFFEKVTLRVASPEKLSGLVAFAYISSIALLWILILLAMR